MTSPSTRTFVAEPENACEVVPPPSRIESRVPLASRAPMNCWPALGCTDCCEKVPAPRQNTVPVSLALTAFWMLEPAATETPEQTAATGGGCGGGGVGGLGRGSSPPGGTGAFGACEASVRSGAQAPAIPRIRSSAVNDMVRNTRAGLNSEAMSGSRRDYTLGPDLASLPLPGRLQS